MTGLTSRTLSEAREGLAKKSFTSLELTDADTAAIEAARALNRGSSGQGGTAAGPAIDRPPFDEKTLFSPGEVIEQAAGRFTPLKCWA
jgi:hypothetical protein